jgi:3'-phosphoadenosine 5'-phosphosulfate (PAPS) 3'-phosphatase
MAGANNKALKAHGFKAREIKKIRAGYGVISSAKDAVNAAQRVGIAVPAKLQARIASATPAPRATSDTDRGKALRGEVKRIAEQAFGEAAARVSKAIRSQGELTEKSREAKLARKVSENDARIMHVAQAAMTHFMRTGEADAFAHRLTKSEWDRAKRLMLRL